MTAHLSPLIHSPFTTSFFNSPYMLQSHPYEITHDDGPPSRFTSFTGRTRNFTSISYLKTPSATTGPSANDENTAIPSKASNVGPTAGQRSTSLQAPLRHSTANQLASPRRLLQQAFQDTTAALAADETPRPCTSESSEISLYFEDAQENHECASEANDIRESIEEEVDAEQRRQNLTNTLRALEGCAGNLPRLNNGVGLQGEDTISQFKRWADSFRRRKRRRIRSPLAPMSFDSGRNFRRPATSNSQPNSHRQGHSKRISNTSSAFVETIKTASLSAVSLSIAERSNRTSRMSDSRDRRNSRQSASIGRPSIDNEISQQTAALDEAALCRSIKRRQILEEIVSSERGYVSDLKALANVFSTLLASSPNLSPQTRSSIHRNIMEILHLHEHLLNELEASSNNHGRNFKHAMLSASVLPGRHSGMGRSWNQPEIGREKFGACTTGVQQVDQSVALAAPHEAAEVARIIKKVIPRFFAYEEYCAKYDIMAHALSGSSRSAPSWQHYETGVEALANSIVAIEDRLDDGKRGLTVGDLLIKPIQRVCKYPLLLADLHKHTPVADCPVSHEEIDNMLYNLRDTVKEINLATDDPSARERIRRTWLLQERLIFPIEITTHGHFRSLGHVALCGVLHVAYQTKVKVQGEYMLCALFKAYLVLAAPQPHLGKFRVVAVIYLPDLKVEVAEDTKGLQCHTALYSWKTVFESDNHLFELIFSACSASEEDTWRAAIQDQSSLTAPDVAAPREPSPEIFTRSFLDLKPAGSIFGQAGTLARRLSIQRAATVGARNNPCQVIIRNTHRPSDTQEPRETPDAIKRSQSLYTTHRTVVLAPKRSDRVRLEQALGDVYSKDILQYPGMTNHRSAQLIRASAGTLVRKLSFVSMPTAFSRRSMSLTNVPTKRSMEKLLERGEGPYAAVPTPASSTARAMTFGGEQRTYTATPRPSAPKVEHERPPSPPRRVSVSGIRGLARRGTAKYRRNSRSTFEHPRITFEQAQPPPQPPEVLDVQLEERHLVDKLDARKRWSNPLGLLKNISSDGMKHLLYSSKGD